MKSHSVIRILLVLCVTFSLARVSTAQQAPNAVFLELGGSAVLYSINYDRHLTPDMGFRVGFGYLGLSASSSDQSTDVSSASASVLIIPATFNYFLGTGSSRLELGAGIVYVSLSASVSGGVGSAFSGSGIGGAAVIGYRYQPSDGGLLFRASFTPIIGSGGFLPWAGLSVGYAF